MAYKAKKSYGQHFLTDLNIAGRIADSLSIDLTKNVIEIGPGKGVLTNFLVTREINLRLIEADRDMVAFLKIAKIVPEENIIHLDFLKANLAKVFEGEPLNIIGNFPYNISSQIVFRMLKYYDLVPEMVGMFQLEMAERIVALHGSKKYGVISVLTQAIYDGELLFEVNRNVFNPPPNVRSAVIRLRRKANLNIDYDYSFFKHVVKTAFGQRRKMLRNTLKSLVAKTNFEDDELLMKRPEQLSVQEFINLSKILGDESRA